MKVLEADEHGNILINDKTAITIGKFDGIHRGHKALISIIKKRADESGLKSCIVTFSNLPNGTSDNIGLLTTEREKIYLLEDLGIDYMAKYSFTEFFQNMNPYAFIDSILVDCLNVQSIAIGNDFRFGRNREGSIKNIHRAQMIYGFTIDEPESVIGDDGEIISSTHIKELLKNGYIEKVNNALGHNYFFLNDTQEGNKLGRKIGFPTLNIYPDENKLLPPYGVYAVKVSIDKTSYKGVANIGTKPTINSSEKVSLETHLLDFDAANDKEHYKIPLKIELLKFIRPEKQFKNTDMLKEAIEQDIVESRKFFGLHNK